MQSALLTLIETLTVSHARALAALFALAIVLFVPGQASLPPMDRDEPRFAQASKQMLETGDYVDIRFQGEARHKKPVGIYWLQAASVKAGEALGIEDARRQIRLYRIPSLLGAIASVLLAYWVAIAFLARRHAFLAAALMGATVILGVEARLAKTDAMLLATILAAMGALARHWLHARAPEKHPAPGPANAFILWTAIGLGLLLKGPITPLIAALTAATLSVMIRDARWLRGLRPWLGLMIAAAIVLPWLIALIQKSGLAFFEEAIGRDMLGKVASGQEKHGAPPGLYLAIFWGTGWPLAPLALASLAFIKREWRDNGVLFLLAWIVPAWAMFELVPTKLPHYVMPLYPALAILALLAVERGAFEKLKRWQKAALARLAALPLALLIGAPAGFWHLDRKLPYLALPFLITGFALSLLALKFFWRAAPQAGIAAACLAALALHIGAFRFGAPDLNAIRLSPRLAEAARAAGCADPLYATQGFREPSLVFLTRTDLAMLEGPGAADFLKGPGCRIAFVEKRHDVLFEAGLKAAGVSPALVTRVTGININSGRQVDIGVWVKRAP